jgi:hypothetical protein
MAANQESESQPDKAQQTNAPERKIDRNAPAGTENSLGAQSIRDGRPATDDSIVEAIDEVGPGALPPEHKDKISERNH